MGYTLKPPFWVLLQVFFIFNYNIYLCFFHALLCSLLCLKRYDLFLFSFGIFQRHSSSAPAVQHITNHNICLFYHPLISSDNRQFLWNRFQRRIQGTVTRRYVFSPIQIGQNQNQFDMRILLFLFCQYRSCQSVKGAVSAKVKRFSSLYNQILYYSFQPSLYFFLVIKFSMPSKCNNHGRSPLYLSYRKWVE